MGSPPPEGRQRQQLCLWAVAELLHRQLLPFHCYIGPAAGRPCITCVCVLASCHCLCLHLCLCVVVVRI